MSQSKDISTALLKAFETMTKNNATQAQTSNVIECAISAIVDNAAGIYTVQYQNSTFNVYSNSTVRYNIKDTVYVLIPGNDMSKKKIILGLVDSSKDEAKSSDDGDTSKYLIIADNILAINPNDVLNLNSYHSPESKIFFSGNTSSSDQATMPEYLKTYKTYGLTMKVKTELSKEQQVAGNYGIKLTLPFYRLNENGEKMVNDREFIFDIHRMLGNPYNFANFTSQSYFFTLEDEVNIYYDNRRSPIIEGFVENFSSNSSITTDDIFIKDIKFVVAKELSQEEMNGNYLTIKSNSGNYFLKNYYETKKTLTPILKIKGAIKDVEGYDCYWFVKDNSIDSNSEYYSDKGGRGWKCLNTKTKVESNNNSDESFQFVTNEYSLDINITDVRTSAIYRCVILYNDEKISGTTEIINLNSNIKLSLRSTTGDYHFVKDIGYVTLVEDVYYPSITDAQNKNVTFEYYWNRYDKNNNFIDDNFFEYDGIANTPSEGHYLTNIKYPTAKMQEANTIECTVQMITSNDDGTKIKENLGTSTAVVFAIDTKDFSTYLRNHIRLYNYDSDGDSPFSKYYDKSIKGLENIEPLAFKIYKADGTELNETEYKAAEIVWSIPKNSMLEIDKVLIDNEDDDYYYVFGEMNLPYSIAGTYNASKSDNTIVLNTKFSGCQMQTYTNFTFIKDGGNGTNGTNYAAEIIVDGYAYGTPHSQYGYPCKLQYVYIGEESQWYLYDMQNNCLTKDLNMLSLDVNVYSQGGIITDDSLYTVEWSIFDDKTTNPCFKINNKQLVPIVTTFDKTAVYCTIIQARVKVTDTSIANADWDIYTYYPIEISYVNKKSTVLVENGNKEQTVVLPTLDGGYTEVLYASDGTNPSYDNTDYFTIKDSLYNIESKDVYTYDWETSSNLIIQNDKEAKELAINEKKIKPIAKYDSGESKNYIKTTISINPNLKKEIENTKKEFEIEISTMTEKTEVLSYYKKQLENALKYFQYNTYIKILQDIDDYPKMRTDMITIAVELEHILNYLYDYYLSHDELQSSSFNFNYKKYLGYINKDIESIKTSISIPTGRPYIEKIEPTEKQLEDMKKTCQDENKIIIYNTFIEYLERYNDNVSSFYKIRNKLMVQDPDTGEAVYKNTEELLKNLFYTNSKTKINDIYPLYASVSAFETLIQPYEDISKYIDERFYADVTNVKNELERIRCTTSISDYKYSLNEIEKIYERWGVLTDDAMEISAIANLSLSDQLKIVEYQLDLKKMEYNDYVALANISIDNIVHIKPILMLYNRYELSNVNAWDGNKIYTGDNDEYLLAPQVGAGRKEADNSFTGMIMGLRNLNNSSNKSSTSQVGLFGYSKGTRSLFLNAQDGSAIFGIHKNGQIIIDPKTNKALLYSGSFYNNIGSDGKPINYSTANESGKGMLIDLTTPEIRYGNGNFSVTSEGHLTAKGGGSIAGWNINDTKLSKGQVEISSDNIKRDKDGKPILDENNKEIIDNTKIAFKVGDTFKVTHEGKITATSGNIAGWSITDKGFMKGKTGWNDTANAGAFFGTEGLYLGIGGKTEEEGSSEKQSFYVYGPDCGDIDKIGLMCATGVELTGKITATSGNIAGWDIQKHYLCNSKEVENEDGSISYFYAGIGEYGEEHAFWAGSHGPGDSGNAEFRVGHDGSLVASRGEIGGCVIEDGNLKVDTINIRNNAVTTDEIAAGTITANNIKAGTITATEVNVKSLQAAIVTAEIIKANMADIGGWKISTSSIYSGSDDTNVTLSSDASKPGLIVKGYEDTSTGTNSVTLFIGLRQATEGRQCPIIEWNGYYFSPITITDGSGKMYNVLGRNL